MERGQERKRLQQAQAQEKERYAREGVLGHGVPYRWIDSTADKGGTYPIGKSFMFAVPEGMRFSEFIEGVLHDRRGNARGVEFGGVGANFFSSFSKGFFAHTVGISLHDERRFFDEYKPDSELHNHTYIQGDFFDDSVYDRIREVLGDAHVDFIVERIGGGVDLNIQHPIMLARLLARWYRLLRAGGIMCVQVPVSMNEFIPLWVAHVESITKYIHIDFRRAAYDASPYAQSAIVLRKYEDAPEDLPLLPARTVL